MLLLVVFARHAVADPTPGTVCSANRDWAACLPESWTEEVAHSGDGSCQVELLLAADLMEEGSWEAASDESQRVLLHDPDNPVARLMGYVANARLGRHLASTVDGLEDLVAHAGSRTVRALAAYEAARLRITAGDWARAYEWLKLVFLDSPTPALFLRSGCTLDLLGREHPELEAGNMNLRVQLLTCEQLWDAPLRRQCALSRPVVRKGLFSLPGRAIVSFYRSCISPALGARCSLEPSCSQLFLEASRKHGLMGFPILADRLIREPSVVAAAHHTVQVGSRRLIADPLSDHDFWMSSKP